MAEPLKIYHCLSLCKNTHRKDLSFNKKTFSILIQIESRNLYTFNGSAIFYFLIIKIIISDSCICVY